MIKNITRYSLILLLLFIAVGCKTQSKEKANFKDFTLRSLDGEEYTLSKLKGNVVLVDFWATWCPPCRMSIPTFIKMYNKFNERGFVILGISLEDETTLDRFRNQMQINYPILLGTKEIAKAFDVQAIPKMVIFDRKGQIRKTQVGFAPELEAPLEKLIDSLLSE